MAFISFQPHDHFDVPTWTGSDSTTTINGMAFKPDSLWIKNYSGSGNPILNNSSDGVAKNWSPSGNNPVDTTTYVASYTSDGFTLTGNIANTNDASDRYIGACWKANGGTTASNTTGSINSTVQVNTTAGVSIGQFTGTGANGTIGHGLGVAPKIVITKSTATSDRGLALNMGKTFVADPQTDLIQFCGTGGTADEATGWNDTAPTTTVFSVGSLFLGNASSQACIFYAFAEIKGFSKFGFYSGTGNIAGTKVYCGFKPKWILVKGASASGDDWGGNSSVLTGFGVGGQRTRAFKFNNNSSQTTANVQFESNGFRLASSSTGNNQENTIYWYMAFAEMPMVGTNGTIALAT